MKLRIYTLAFFVMCLLPPVAKVGTYHTQSGHLKFHQSYMIAFLVVAFLFIHELIHHFGADHHDSESESESKSKS